MTHPIFKYALPAAVLAGLSGFFVGSTLAEGSGRSEGNAGLGALLPINALEEDKPLTLRERFLSSSDDAVDYDKLARVCMAAAQQGGGGHSIRTASSEPSAFAEPGSAKTVAAKDSLDQVMTLALDQGQWSRAAGFRARMTLKKLPPSDVADFEKLLLATIERGDLRVSPGAWMPRTIH